MNSISKTFLVVVTVSTIATTGDICMTWLSPVYPKLYSNNTSINPLNRPITILEDDVLGSVLPIGAILGPFIYGIIAEKFGRKIALLLLTLPYVISFLLIATIKHIYMFWIARFLSGLSVGAAYSLVPLYVGEISEQNNRGAMIGTICMFWCLGDFIILLIGPYLSFVTLNFVIICFPITFFLLFCIIGVESPYYLISIKKDTEAVEALMFLRSNNKQKVNEEIEVIVGFLKAYEDGKLFDLLKDILLLKHLLICLCLLMSISFGGINVILSHMELIFEISGTNLSPDISAIIVGGILVGTSFIGPLLADKKGRRPLLIVSCAGMFVSLCVLGAFFYFANRSYNVEAIRWMPLLCLASYIAFFNSGLSNIPWTILSELFPNEFKNIASSICTTIFWISNFFVAMIYNRLIEYFATSGLFWFFSISCFTSAIFTFIFVPETKGKSFSDIQKLFNKKSYKNDADTKVTTQKLIT